MRYVNAPAIAFAAIFAAAAQNAPQPKRLTGNFYLERSDDSFGVRSHGIIEKTASGSKLFPLPQSTFESYRRLRAVDLEYMRPYVMTANDYHRIEVIGPYQMEGSRIWFGNQYYDGEGFRGVGAFGYFDTAQRKYVLYSPPEIARRETGALLVEQDAVWLGMDQFGEGPATEPDGLLRWDRRFHQARRYPLDFVVSKIRRARQQPDTLVLTTVGGYALFRDGHVRRFQTLEGKEKAVDVRRVRSGGNF